MSDQRVFEVEAVAKEYSSTDEKREADFDSEEVDLDDHDVYALWFREVADSDHQN